MEGKTLHWKESVVLFVVMAFGVVGVYILLKKRRAYCGDSVHSACCCDCGCSADIVKRFKFDCIVGLLCWTVVLSVANLSVIKIRCLAIGADYKVVLRFNGWMSVLGFVVILLRLTGGCLRCCRQ